MALYADGRTSAVLLRNVPSHIRRLSRNGFGPRLPRLGTGGIVFAMLKLCCLSVCVLVSLSGQALADSVADTLRGFGYSGHWAVECGAPPSADNPHSYTEFPTTGSPTISTESPLTVEVKVIEAKLASPDGIATIREMRMNRPFPVAGDEPETLTILFRVEVLTRKFGDKMRAWQVTSTQTLEECMGPDANRPVCEGHRQPVIRRLVANGHFLDPNGAELKPTPSLVKCPG